MTYYEAAKLGQRGPMEEFVRVKIGRGGPRLLNSFDVDQILKRYKDGESLRQLAEAFEIHRSTVRAHLIRHGIERRGPLRSLTDDQCADIATLYRSGSSLAQLGERFAVHPKTVSNELRKLGIKVRPQGKNYRHP